jgi:hypothetical protein
MGLWTARPRLLYTPLRPGLRPGDPGPLPSQVLLLGARQLRCSIRVRLGHKRPRPRSGRRHGRPGCAHAQRGELVHDC